MRRLRLPTYRGEMIRKYGLTADFDDPDFSMDAPVQKFFNHSSVMVEWYYREKKRRSSGETPKWHWVVLNLRTGEDITPDWERIHGNGNGEAKDG